MAARPQDDREGAELWPSEQLVSDAVGRLMDFWGFKRNMGRLWAVLYLADEPLPASALRSRLHLSAGSVSMALNELQRWGVVNKVWIQGERRDHFVAEGRLWKMVSRVLREREFVEVIESIASLERAVELLQAEADHPDPRIRELARMKKKRTQQLLDLARLGRTLLEKLISTARLDAAPLSRFWLGP